MLTYLFPQTFIIISTAKIGRRNIIGGSSQKFIYCCNWGVVLLTVLLLNKELCVVLMQTQFVVDSVT